MAGHNKWSKIHRKKGAKDIARSTQFSKASRAIEAASRQCNGDLSNLHLQSVIARAKSIQLPKDRITDALARGANPTAGSRGNSTLTPLRYDGMISTKSGKVACIVMALSDNRNRTASRVRAAITKADGELLTTGANDWLFDHVGVVSVRKKGATRKTNENQSENEIPKSLSGTERNDYVPIDQVDEEREEEALLECALGGATDVDYGTIEDEHAMVKCDATDLHSLVMTLHDGGYETDEFETRYVVKEEVTGQIVLNEDSSEKLESFLDKMDEDLDVTNIFHNAAS